MSYEVKEIFLTLQGEGLQTGRRAVFCRFSGCNLWSGKETDRASSPCWFCDTDFADTEGPGGGCYKKATELASAIRRHWGQNPMRPAEAPYVVFTGGEPMLQLDQTLIEETKALGFETAIETNGTIPVPPLLDWITVSPKVGAELAQKSGNELKLVYPQALDPRQFLALDFQYFFLMPMHLPDAAGTRENIQQAVAYCLANPPWRVTMQSHKLWGLP